MTEEEIQYYINSSSLSILIGRKLSELDIKNDSLVSSYFMVSVSDNGVRKSRKISYENLIKQMAKDISALLGLSSMAFEETSSYSRNIHSHEYNFAACYPKIQISDYVKAGLEPRYVATVLTSNSQTSGVVSVLYPVVQTSEPVLPDVGEMRLIASTKTSSTAQISESIQKGTFDGWVYPNGATYYKTTNYYDFTEAFNLYGGTGNTFNVPNFNDFIKLNASCDNQTNKVNYQNFIQKHGHPFENTGNLVEGQLVNVDITFPATNGPGDLGRSTGGLHTQYKTEVSKMRALTVDINLTGLHTTETNTRTSDEFNGGTSLNIETKPKHVIVPAMVYIGNKLR